MKRIWILPCIGLFLLLTSCGISEATYNQLLADYEKLKVEYANLQAENQELKIKQMKHGGITELSLAENLKLEDYYQYYAIIDTKDIASLYIKLARDEKLEATLIIWDAVENRPSNFIFYILDSSHKPIADVGMISKRYSFEFEAERTGDYILVLDDRDGDCIIEMFYNSPAEIYY